MTPTAVTTVEVLADVPAVRRCAALLAVLGLGVAAVPALGTGIGPFAGTPTNVRSIDPRTADPAISRSAADHVVIPTGAGNGRLFVFLPGSGASPLGYDDVLEAAGAAGYRAIGLSYDNATTVSGRCGNDPSCFGPVHQEVLDGTDASPDITVRPTDGIEHRLGSLLTYLAVTYPGEGWGAFVSAGSPVWSEVVLGGHSQGAAEAAYTGVVRHLAGVLLLSGVVDGGSNAPMASWLTLPRLTPATAYVGLANTRDPWFARETASWVALGLPGAGAPVSIDGGGATTTAHAFSTAAASRSLTLTGGHDEPAVDPDVPVCTDGSPSLAPVWTAMLALAAGATSVHVAPAC